MRGAAYALFRTNLGVVRSMMQVYSQPARHVLAMDYLRDDYHMRIPDEDLDDFHLPNGLHIKMTKPMEEWIVQFDDGRGNRWDLLQTALMPAVSVTELEVAVGDRSALELVVACLQQERDVGAEMRLVEVAHDVVAVLPARAPGMVAVRREVDLE